MKGTEAEAGRYLGRGGLEFLCPQGWRPTMLSPGAGVLVVGRPAESKACPVVKDEVILRGSHQWHRTPKLLTKSSTKPRKLDFL